MIQPWKRRHQVTVEDLDTSQLWREMASADTVDGVGRKRLHAGVGRSEWRVVVVGRPSGGEREIYRGISQDEAVEAYNEAG